jgi:SAM-dependent methyltransferase
MNAKWEAGRMTGAPGWQRLDTTATEAYHQQLVPALLAPWVSPLLDLAELVPGDAVLDVACGTGAVTRPAAVRVGHAGRVVGLDINPAMLEVARSVPAADGAAIAWVEANAQTMPLPDESFDVVLCQQGLQQIPDRPAALAEMRRVLRAGGRLALSVWSGIERNPLFAALADALERHVGPEAARNRRAPLALGDAGDLRALVAGGGFHSVTLHTRVIPARFPSPERFVAAQLAATPLATVGAVPAATREAVARDVRADLAGYLDAGELVVPMEAHILLAVRPAVP